MLEHVFRVLRHVRAVFEPRAGRHDVIGRHLVPDLDHRHPLHGHGQRLAGRHLPDVRAARDRRAGHPLARRFAEQEHAVVHVERCGLGNPLGQRRQRARIGEHARQRRRGRRFRAHQINLRGLRPRAPLKVPVAGAQADRAGPRRHVIADAEAARVLQDAHARRHEIGEQPFSREHRHHLARTRRHADLHVGVNLFPAQHQRRGLEVAIRRIGAGADQHLIHFFAGQRSDRRNVARRMRAGRHRLDQAQVELQHAVIPRAFVGLQFGPILTAALSLQKRQRRRVAREDRRGHAQFRAHVGDGRARRHAQPRHTRAAVLQHAAHVALGPVNLQHFQDHVFGRHAGLERPAQAHQRNLRAGQVERPSPHRHRHVDAARTDRDHPDAAAGGRVGIAAQQRRPRLAETLEVELVADAVARPRKHNAVTLRNAFQIGVVVRILEPHLNRVVIHIAHGQIGLHAVEAHALELQIRHRAGRVLRQRLVNADRQLAARLQLPRHTVRGQNLLNNVLRHT